jgi:hypothetical protein
MEIAGRHAVPLKLYCSLKETGCPGYISNEVLMYLTEAEELVIFGHCEECGQHGTLIVSLTKLISQCPLTTTAVM